MPVFAPELNRPVPKPKRRSTQPPAGDGPAAGDVSVVQRMLNDGAAVQGLREVAGDLNGGLFARSSLFVGARRNAAGVAPVQRVDIAAVDRTRIRIERAGSGYIAYYDNKKAGELELFDGDDGRVWINYVETGADFQRKGIGLLMLEAAVADHDAIYASTASRQDHEGDDADTRHLSMEGAALVGSAIRNGVMQEGWLTNPFLARGGNGDDDDAASAGMEAAPDGIQDLSIFQLPARPNDLASIWVDYVVTHAVDGDGIDALGLTFLGTGGGSVSHAFGEFGAIMFATVEQMTASFAAHYGLGDDRIAAALSGGRAPGGGIASAAAAAVPVQAPLGGGAAAASAAAFSVQAPMGGGSAAAAAAAAFVPAPPGGGERAGLLADLRGLYQRSYAADLGWYGDRDDMREAQSIERRLQTEFGMTPEAILKARM